MSVMSWRAKTVLPAPTNVTLGTWVVEHDEAAAYWLTSFWRPGRQIDTAAAIDLGATELRDPDVEPSDAKEAAAVQPGGQVT